MNFTRLNPAYVRALAACFDGQEIRIYKGAMPADAIAYGDGTGRAADLLASGAMNDLTFNANLFYNDVVTTLTASADGTAAWFVLYGTTNGEVLMAELGDTSSSKPCILDSLSLTNGQNFDILSLSVSANFRKVV